jgi:bacterioferritin
MMNTQTHMPVTLAMSQSSADSPTNGQGLTVYLDSAPYPTVGKGSDPNTVKMLKEDYAGAVSEMTAVAQYIYQNILSTDYESFANAILQIAIVEMSHLDMLGDAILALGGNPTFGNGSIFWQPSSVNYSRTLPEMLMADINSESQAIVNYESHASQTTNSDVKALLERIVQDEQLHLRFFQETLASLTGAQSTSAQATADPLMRELTVQQLAAFDGKNGRRSYIADDGIIYDVTNSPVWHNGMHEDYAAGKDLTAEFARSPHGQSVLNDVPMVGRLI